MSRAADSVMGAIENVCLSVIFFHCTDSITWRRDQRWLWQNSLLVGVRGACIVRTGWDGMVQLRASHGLEAHGIDNPGQVHWNLTTPILYEEAVRRQEGWIAQQGPIDFHTGRHTGRSPK